jgi:hypothetical protein
MTPRNLVRLAVALGLLLILWGAVAVASRRGRDVVPQLLLPKVAAADVDTVSFSGARDTVVLAKVRPGVWHVNGHPADEHLITELLTSLGDTGATGELVAESPTSYSQLGVDSASGRRVRIGIHGKTVLDVVAGKPGVVYGTGYLRPPADSAVYLIRSALPGVAGRRADQWRDPRIAAVPADSVGKVEIQRGAKRFTLARRGGRWTLQPGGPADSMAVQNLLRALADIRAAGFAAPAQADSLKFSPAARRLRVLGPGGAVRLSLVFDSTAAGVWTRADTGGTVWRLERYAADELTPADSALAARRAKPEPRRAS